MELALLGLGLLVLLALGMPIAFALLLTASGGLFLWWGGVDALYQVPLQGYIITHSFVLIAIPLFILMAQLLMAGGVVQDLFAIMSAWLRRLPGGLLISTIGACTFFSAISGTSVATAATVGMVALPEMTKRGYDRKMTVGALSAGGGLGMLIPPSVPLILYGALTEESIGTLFMAGIIPGLVLALLYSLLIFFFVAIGRIKVSEPPATWRERLGTLRKGVWGLMLPFLVLGGIYVGFFTPTESAAVGVVAALIITMGIYRSVKVRHLVPIALAAMKTSVMIYAIIFGALVFAHLATLLHIPQDIVDWVVHLPIHPMAVIILFQIGLLVLGMFLDVGSILLITLPVAYPVIKSLGFDGIWFAVLFIINMNLAVETPPVGLNLYVIQGISKDMPIEDIVKGVAPFYLCEIAGLILVLMFPALALWLPSTMF